MVAFVRFGRVKCEDTQDVKSEGTQDVKSDCGR